MARIVFAWELGGGYGHLLKLRPLARALAASGHEVACVFRDTERARALMEEPGVSVYPAPAPGGRRPRMPLAVNYSEVLIRSGWLDRPALARRLEGWQALFRQLRPRVLIANHAPAALLAARGSEIRRVLFGTGFECPQVRDSSPVFGPWVPTPRPRLEAGEQQLLAAINAALAARGLVPLQSLAELPACEQRLLCTYPELDPYAPQRGDARNHGTGAESTGRAPPPWQQEAQRRVFIYLGTTGPTVEPLLAALSDSGVEALPHIPRLDAALRRRFDGKRLRFSQETIDLAEVAGAVRLAICNAGHGTVSTFLRAGTPLLLLPSHVEQWLTTRLLVRAGVGRELVSGQDGQALAQALADSLDDQAMQAGARAFARRYQARSASVRLATLRSAIEELLP